MDHDWRRGRWRPVPSAEFVSVHNERRTLLESYQSDRGDDRNRCHGRGVGRPSHRRHRRSATRPLTVSPSENEARLRAVNQRVVACIRCPRLVEWRLRVAREKRAAYASEAYWGRPVPSFGDPDAELLIVGLAPGAHGANRTGRMFTGDRSGDWLYRALHRAGFANQPDGRAADDGLCLTRAYITAAVRCAPPANRPTAAERDHCRPYLEEELEIFRSARVVVALGRFAFDQVLRILQSSDEGVPQARPKFSHGVEVDLGSRTVLGCYHPSQQNTFTGRLTESMFDSVWERAKRLITS